MLEYSHKELLGLPSQVWLEMFVSVDTPHKQREVDGVDGDADNANILQYEEKDVPEPDTHQVRYETNYHLSLHGTITWHHLYNITDLNGKTTPNK